MCVPLRIVCSCSPRSPPRSWLSYSALSAASVKPPGRAGAVHDAGCRAAAGPDTSPQAEARAALALRGRPALPCRCGVRPNGHVVTRVGTSTEFGSSSRDEHRRAARAPGWASSPPRCRTASWPGCTRERRAPPAARRLLPARGPVRPPPRAAQGRRAAQPASRSPSVARALRPRRGASRSPTSSRGGELRPLLRLLHPRPERPPAEASGRVAGRQPHRDPRHRTRPARSARRPRRDASAPRIPTSNS